MSYLATHDLACGCRVRTPVLLPTPLAVAAFLWGRTVQHVVWQNECPYRFYDTDVWCCLRVLEHFPLAGLRSTQLPCTIWRQDGDQPSLVAVVGEPLWAGFLTPLVLPS